MSSAGLWDVPGFHTNYTGLSLDGAEWCLRRGIRLVGIDYLSIERVDSPTAWRTHLALLGARAVILEGLDMRGVQPGEYNPTILDGKGERVARVATTNKLTEPTEPTKRGTG